MNVIRPVYDLAEHIEFVPRPTEFFDYLDERSTVLELDAIARSRTPPSLRPHWIQDEDGNVTYINFLGADPLYTEVSVFFVGGNIVCMYTQTMEGPEQVRTAVPLDEVNEIMCVSSLCFHAVDFLNLMSCSTKQQQKRVGQVDQPQDSQHSTVLASKRVRRASIVRLNQFRGHKSAQAGCTDAHERYDALLCSIC